MSASDTVFLRLEGPLQAWGDTSKFVIRRTMDAPTKSGVLGLVCCAQGLSRREAREKLPELNGLAMGVRIDRPGVRWWDYHTVGAGTGMTTAGGGVKTGAKGTLVTRREYLSDASFLVALQGEPSIVESVAVALESPKWPVYLGRRSCPPSLPVLARSREGENWASPSHHDSLESALSAAPWRPRFRNDEEPADGEIPTLIEWRAAIEGELAPEEAEVWYDAPVSFDPPVHHPRLVLRRTVEVEVRAGEPFQIPMPASPRPRANYTNTEYRKRRKEVIEDNAGLCVFCKSPGPRMTVQHVTYRRAGGNETADDLRSLCGLCHDAVTMIEYGLGMGLDRIDPCEARWRDAIIRKRREIIEFRSLETRRRHLASVLPEEVE